MITVFWCGQLGNQMFEYAFGRLLARRMDMRLVCPPLFYLDKRYEKPTNLFRPAPVSGGREYAGTPCVLEQHRVDIGSLNGTQPLELRGWFQRYEYYRAHLDEIREWFPLHESTQADRIAIHLRCTDFWKYPHRVPSLDLYREALKHCPDREVVVVTDDPDDPYVRTFVAEYDATVRSESTESDFQFLAESRYLIYNLISAFGWWAGVLGHCECSIAVMNASWLPRYRKRGTDLTRTGDPSYSEIIG